MSIFIRFFRRLNRIIGGSDVVWIITLTAVLIATGTISYNRLEGWGWLDSLYVTIITISTVGYGDLSPQTPQGRIFAIFFSFIAIGVGGYAITSLAAYLIENREAKKEYKLRKKRMAKIADLKDHYIVCGSDLVGTRIAQELSKANAPFVMIDNDEHRLKFSLLYVHPEYAQQKISAFINVSEVDVSDYEKMSLAEVSAMVDIPYLLESPTEDLSMVRAGIDRAKGLIAAMSDSRDNLGIVVGAKALAARAGNENLRIMARVEDSSYISKMMLAGAHSVRMPALITGGQMALHMMQPTIGEWWYDLTKGSNSNSTRMHEIYLKDRPEWVGLTSSDLHKRFNVLPVTVKRNGDFMTPPPADLVLTADDILITIADLTK